jgi:mono/diheme cytochrome c family protein
MKRKGVRKGIGLIILSSMMGLFSFQSLAEGAGIGSGMQADAQNGKKLFEGSTRFANGGPSCISCHNVNHSELISGGLYAKDLTKVYDRLGEGISGWLSAPPFPAMASSYQNHPLSEKERNSLMAFFKHANEKGTETKSMKGFEMMLCGGLIGLACILILISILYAKRKKGTVKKDIFERQSKAWDAKF